MVTHWRRKRLENPRDGGAWWAAIYGVAQSRTRLKRLSSSSSSALGRASQVTLVVKNPPANAGDVRDMGSISGPGRPPGEGNGNPLQHSCLENSVEQWSMESYSLLLLLLLLSHVSCVRLCATP